MPEPTPVFIVTSSRPRVGKTARALTEYFCAQRRPVAAFDVNPDEFKLIDHLPAYAAASSLNDTRGEMALFDQLVLEDQVPKVVDLGHQPFDRFFAVMQQIDFATEVLAAPSPRWCCSSPTPTIGRGRATPTMVRSVVDRRHFSFVTYVLNSNDNTSELYQWLGRVFIAFRELEVRLLLGGIAPLLKHSA